MCNMIWFKQVYTKSHQFAWLAKWMLRNSCADMPISLRAYFSILHPSHPSHLLHLSWQHASNLDTQKTLWPPNCKKSTKNSMKIQTNLICLSVINQIRDITETKLSLQLHNIHFTNAMNFLAVDLFPRLSRSPLFLWLSTYVTKLENTYFLK